ncbi:MAG: caspase family protein [Geminicoccaceae bacterium]
MLVGGVMRAFGPFILAAILLLGFVSANVSAADDRRIALVIGNGAYRNMPKLANPPRDAALIAAKLRTVGFEVDLAINDDHLSLKQRVRSFGLRARGASAALFYYAGHGLQADGSNYLLPVDAKVRKVADLRAQSLPLSLVSDELEIADAKISLIILDACRDNPLTRSLSGRRGTRTVKITRGLASVQRASGRLIAYATAPGNVAYDGGKQNSPFTQAVADLIEEPGLEVGHMFERVREQVIAATNGKQVPWIEAAILGDFYFHPIFPDTLPAVATPAPEPTTPLPAPLPKVTREEPLQPPRPSDPEPNDQIETAWSKTTTLGTRDAYIKFLEQYPESMYAQKAVAMLLEFASPIAPVAPAPEPALEPAAALPAASPPATSLPAAPLPAAPLPKVTKKEPVQPPRPSDPEPNDQIEAAWSKTTALGTRDAYIKFLEQYPESIFAQQAVAMLLQFASPTAPATQ